MLATRFNRTRVLIVDDQEIVREAFAMVLSGDPTLEVVGASADGEAAVEMASALRPDVVVMDVRMPRLNGVDAAPAYARMGSRCRCYPSLRIR